MFNVTRLVQPTASPLLRRLVFEKPDCNIVYSGHGTTSHPLQCFACNETVENELRQAYYYFEVHITVPDIREAWLFRYCSVDCFEKHFIRCKHDPTKAKKTAAFPMKMPQNECSPSIWKAIH